MTSDDELRELRRTAFGKTSTPDERRKAAHKLAAIEAERASAEHARVERERTDQERSDGGHKTPVKFQPEHESPPATYAPPATAGGARDAENELRSTKRAVPAIWMVPIILVSLAVGAIGGSVWSPAQRSVTKPSARPSFALGTDSSGQPGGDLAAADSLLNQKRSSDDVFPLPDLVQNLRQSSVRFLGGASDAVQLWVGLNSEEELCLLLYEDKSGSGAASCATPTDFTSQGITLGFNQYQVSWNGAKFDVFKPYGS